MSKVSSEVLDILFTYIKNSALISDTYKPNGDVVKNTRPVNSDKEDVVINLLPLSREAIQRGVANVNIYVKNQDGLVFNGIEDLSQPDQTRISYLSILANTVLSEIWDTSGKYCFTLQQDTVESAENNQHYINFRIEFHSVNI